MAARYQVLSEKQADHFIERGFVVLRNCFSRDAAEAMTSTIWTRLGYRADNPSTWREPSIHMPAHRQIDVREFAPKAWLAVCDLIGGEERISRTREYTWSDAFVVNLWEGADRPWAPPSPAAPGWHKDGDWFRHFLDSPDQGLVTLVLWSDVQHRGGATFVAADSVGPVARFLADHPEGVHPLEFPRAPTVLEPGAEPGPAAYEFPFAELVWQCEDFVEATGESGDVYLMHPFVLHAKAQNVLRVPRFITNPPVRLAEPLRFDRSDRADFSLVERAVLRGLGVDRYEFTPTAPRESITPPRRAVQQRMRIDEERRLAALSAAEPGRNQ